MARIPEIIRRNPISQVAAAPQPTGQGFLALAQMAKIGEDFIRPAALQDAKIQGENSVYRDESGDLKVKPRSVLGGELAAQHNSAAYAKYLAQKQIDMSESFTEIARANEFDPAGFKTAADGYIKLMKEDENLPQVLKSGVIQAAQQEASRRFNGLYDQQITRNYSEANRNTKTARDMLSADFVSLFTEGDTKAADDKWKEIEAMSKFRSDAPYISETPAETKSYLMGVRASAKAAKIVRNLNDLIGADNITTEKRSEMAQAVKDPDLAALTSVGRQKLYSATQGRLKGIDAASYVRGLTDSSYEAKSVRVKSVVDLRDYATGGATRTDSFSGMAPEFNSGLQQMISSAPDEIRSQLKIMSGYRSNETQQQLWEGALKKYGSAAKARKWVAPPGKSQHNHGMAADLQFGTPEARKWAHDNAANFGLYFPLSNENWHVELMGSRKGSFASTAVDNRKALSKAGVETSDANLFISSVVGVAGTVSMETANPSAEMASILPEQVMKANPMLENMTVTDFRRWADRKMTVKASDISRQQAQINKIPDLEVRGMASRLLGGKIQDQTRAEAEARSEYDIRLAAKDDTLTAQEVFSDNSLSDRDQAAIVSKLNTAHKGALDIQNTVASLNDPNFSWNPFDSKQRRSVSKAYDASLSGEDPLSSPEHISTAGQIAMKTGFVPTQMSDAIRASVFGNDPKRLATAMEVTNQITKEQPMAFKPNSGSSDIAKALSDYKFYSQFGSAEDAAQKVIDLRSTDKKTQTKNLSDQARRAEKDLKIGDVISHFDNSYFSDPTIGVKGVDSIPALIPASQEVAIMADYSRLFNDAFIETGDIAISKNRALDEMGRIYGPNVVTGSSRIMKYPPQSAYPAVDGSYDWMTRQIEDEVSRAVYGDKAKLQLGNIDHFGNMRWIKASDMRLVSNEKTRAEIDSGRPATYQVFYMKGGQFELAPGGRYKFDPSPDKSAVVKKANRQHDIEINTRRYESLINQYGTAEGTRRYLENVDAIR